MRIGIEAQRIFRPKKHGMEVVALELARQLQQMDPTNEYLLFARPDADRSCLSETRNFKIKEITSFTYADWEQLKFPAAANKASLDILHCTCNTAPLSVKPPLITTIHDIIYLEKIDFKGTSYQNFGNLYRRYVVPRIARHSKMVITVSNFERDTILERLRLPEEKVRVVYNAVDQRFNNRYPAQQVDAFRKKFGLPENFILFLGNTAPKKNTPNVIRAFAGYCRQERDPMPLVVLDYDQALVGEQLARSGQQDCLKHFIFPGYIPSGEMPLMYNAATLFLYPSLRESFGLPILEAMGCGAPVITSNTSSMPEIAGDAALLVDPFQPDQLTGAIRQMLADSSLLATFRQKGIARAAEFTWKASAEQLLKIYQAVIH